jgi:hypothetical protein
MFWRRRCKQKLAAPQTELAKAQEQIAAIGAALQGHTDWLQALELGVTEFRGHTDWMRALELGLADIRAASTKQFRDIDRVADRNDKGCLRIEHCSSYLLSRFIRYRAEGTASR